MKKEFKKIILVFIFLLIFGYTNVKAYSSKDLVNEDDRYCVYANGEKNVNNTIINGISYKHQSKQGTAYHTITIPSGYGKLKLVYQGTDLGYITEGGSKDILQSKVQDGKQLQIYRQTSSTICRKSDATLQEDGTYKCNTSAKTCAVGYITVSSNTCSSNKEAIQTLTNNTVEINRNNNTATTSLSIATNDDYYVKTYIIQDNEEKNVKTIYNDGTEYKISKGYLMNSNVVVHIEYYFRNGDCSKQYAAEADINVEGFKTKDSTIKTFCNTLTSTVKSIIDECNYTYLDYDQDINSEELDGIAQVLQSANITTKTIGNAKLKGITASTSRFGDGTNNKELFCQFNQAKNVTQTYTYNTVETKYTYFTLKCQETVTVEYDSPKLVSNNGGGFSYDVKITPTVSCYAEIDEEKMKELFTSSKGKKCTVSHACYGYDKWSTSYYDNGSWDAGPNENFDACVNSCDGGEYTQNCVNSCYTQVYGNNTSNILNRNISDTYNILNVRTYSDNQTKYSNAWCNNPPSTGSGRYTESYNGSYYYVADHYYPGTYLCVSMKDSDGKNINLLKYFKTLSCGSTCYTTITGNKTYTVTDEELANQKLGANNYVEEADCYLRTSGNQITLDTSKIKQFAKDWETLQEEVNKLNAEGADYSKAEYTYTIHDSTKSYCDNSINKNFESFTEEDLNIDDDNITSNKANTVSSNEITMGFVNTCLKNGESTKGSGKNGCCTSSQGISGGQKFYMAVTTEKNINNVYSWPTTDKANFTEGEKETINKIRENVKKEIGKVVVYDTDYLGIGGKDEKEEVCDDDDKFNYNIKVSLQKLGVLGKDGGWNFDINCFYGYYDSGYGDCGLEATYEYTDGDGEPDAMKIKETVCSTTEGTDSTGDETTTLVNDYIFRTVDVTNLFNSASAIPWNWKTSATTKAVTTNLTARNITYKIDPDTTVKNIQDTGYAYENYRNFHIVMSSSNMRNIRNYNQSNSKITSTSCASKTLGCSNTFIKDYVDTATGDFGITYNNIRDKK